MRGVTNLPVLRHAIDETDVGGSVMICTAGAALKLGDVVYLTGTRTVNKSTTLANHSLICGVVVGGTNSGMAYVTDSAQYNVFTAADNTEQVLVQFNGIVYVIVDAAIVVGTTVIPDTVTAGRVKASASLAGDNGTLAATVGTLAVSAPTKGTLEVGAGGTAVTSTAANGDILTGAPGGAVLSGAPALTGAVAVSGDGFFRGVGKLLQASSAANQIRPVLLTLGA